MGLHRQTKRAAFIALGLIASVVAVQPAHAQVTVEYGLVDQVLVDSMSPSGAQSNIDLIPGLQYRIDVTGFYRYGPLRGEFADAQCSRSSDRNWISDRYIGMFGDPNAAWLALYVNDHRMTWSPAEASGSCEPFTHHYRLAFTPSSFSRVRFAVRDTYHGDNIGTLQVRIYLVYGSISV